MEKLNKNEFFLLGIELELPDLLNFCATSKRINKNLSLNNDIWLYKLKKEFENINFLSLVPKEKYILLYSLRDVKEKLNRKEFLFEIYNLEKLVSDNSLTEIPASLGNLSNLQNLDLSYNSLTEIPASLGNLSNLQILNLGTNKLTKIPASLGNLFNLQKLDLSGNSLTEIPVSLGNLSNLKILYLSYNLLTEIPPSLGNLSNLQELYLSYNNLTRIPASLGNLSNLREFYLYNIPLTEKIPIEIRNLTKVQIYK